ncbi:MAG: hypothetical protein ACRC23_01675 [Aeromonas jandaei]
MKDILVEDLQDGYNRCNEGIGEILDKFYPFKGEPFLYPFVGSSYSSKRIKPIHKIGKVAGDVDITVWLCDDGSNRSVKESVIEELKSKGYTINKSELEEMYVWFDDFYIGRVEEAWSLYKNHGIIRKQKEYVGRSETNGRWYGWSHRAMCSFGIGDMLFDESYEAEDIENIPFKFRGSKRIETDEDAMQAAINFSNYVS